MTSPEDQNAPLHRPVMQGEVMGIIAPRPGGRYLDLTLGVGGHAEGLLERSAPDGFLVGCDQDGAVLAIALARLARYGARLRGLHWAFGEVSASDPPWGAERFDGVLLDLGVSSVQLDGAERGMSFAKSGPLDMRMDQDRGAPLSERLRAWSEEELADLIFAYGQERASRRIARALKRALLENRLHSTGDLADIVGRNRPGGTSRRGIHPATRTFQALRIAVNDELGRLERVLERLPEWLSPGGTALVLSFHSLEDRLVKQAFRRLGRLGLVDVLTPKPLRPTDAECRVNPRARSARLRAARWPA